MGRTTFNGPVAGGIMVHPIDHRQTTGAPVATFDYHPAVFERIIALSSFWNGVGATTQVGGVFFGDSAPPGPGSVTITGDHVPVATEMATPDGLTHGAAAAIAFVNQSDIRDRMPTRLSQGPNAPIEDTGEVSVSFVVNGTFAVDAFTQHIFVAVLSHHFTAGGNGAVAGHSDPIYYDSRDWVGLDER